MRISELIEQLQRLQAQQGDLLVVVDAHDGAGFGDADTSLVRIIEQKKSPYFKYQTSGKSDFQAVYIG